MMLQVNKMMAELSYFMLLLSLVLYLPIAVGVHQCSSDNGRSFSAWDWEVHGLNGSVYHINLCKKAAGCTVEGASVCNNKTNYGSVVTTGTKIPTSSFGNHSFLVTFNGSNTTKCGEQKKVQTQIIFQCHRFLGFPELIDETECLLTFQFSTNEACSTKPTAAEIPCLVYDPKDKIKRDLSPLIKQTGGHLVASSERGVDLWINVCREISNNDDIPAASCDKGSSSCRVDTKTAAGRITDDTKLYYEKGNIKLVYYGQKIDKNCVQKSNTTITFICPRNFQDGGNGPVLISSSSTCQYEIEWKTDYACPDKDILTDSCTFTNGDFTVNLLQLEKPLKEESYRAKAKDYVYRIKVCSNGQPCGSDEFGTHTAVCQINPKEHSDDKSCGDANHRTIRYADRKLTLIYKNGQPCHNGINRTTIIEFECDPTVDDGAPTFLREEHCYYFFKWSTRVVCQSRKVGTCSVNKMTITGRVAFDLSVLTRTNGSWLALNTNAYTAGYVYRINVCGVVSTPYSECDGSAACEVYRGRGRNIGMYSSPLTVLQDNSLQLIYTGEECKGFGRRITTTIRFVCKALDMENPPELVSRSWDGCSYVFTWSTAAACSLRVISGDRCMLNDTVTGNVFDLNDLSKGPTGDGTPFTVNGHSKEKFKIKVCGSLENCGHKKDAGACQTSSGKEYSAGKGNSKLFYYDGKVNLTYSNGSPCHRQNKRQRSTHITFFCNETAGIGVPVYDKENYCTYHFIWYTSRVCPAKTVECLAKDSQGREYDLSSLVRTDQNNWVATDGPTKYYINVCRSLRRTAATQGCPLVSAVCMNGTTNIGSVSSPLKVSDDGLVTLQYKDKQYRTIINFSCHQEVGAPMLDSSSKNIFSFNWKTSAACPVKSHSSSGCSVTSSAGETVSITALTKPGDKSYSIQTTINKETVTITFNICKNVTCGKYKASACLTDKKGPRPIGRLAKSTMEYEGDIIVLTYRGGDYMSGPRGQWGLYAVTIINFICARNVTMGTPVFRSLHENVYTIEFRTSVVCPAKTLQCSFTSTKNKKYNLGPLGLKTGNWMAADTRHHLVYYINVCQAYNPAGLSPACSGPMGGCQVDTKNNKAHGMGFVKSNPFASFHGDLTLRYVGGEGTCHKKFHRSTRINFFCSNIHGSPVFITETEECEYVFNWKTPSACALAVQDAGKNHECEVYDKQNGVLYKLQDLEKKTSGFPLNGSKLVIGFCGRNVKTCSGKIACLLKAGKMTESYSNTELSYYDDTITMTYAGTPKIIGKFNCGTELLSKGEILSQSDKEIVIQWSTTLACRPVEGEECSLTDNGEMYDLSVLARETMNWRARVADHLGDISKDQFYLSVCKPLEKLNTTNRGARAARINSSESSVLVSLGTMDHRLTMSNGYLTMTYNRDDNYVPCRKLSTKIQFVCDIVPEGLGGEPVVDLYDADLCATHFTWVTKAACSLTNQGTQSSPKNCTTIHPATMKTIDLTKLYKSGGYILKDQDGKSYHLNLCGDFTINDCPSGSGMCQKISGKKSLSVGQVNNTLSYRQGFLYLVYKNGDKCPGTDRKMETLISFFCNRKVKGNGEPTLEKTNDCTHYVTWQTPLACEAEVECVTNGNPFYDLSPLIKNNGNYEVFHRGKRYLINVCRSLVNESLCSSKAAVCAIDLTKKNGASSDFGHVTSPPVSTNENGAKARLVYEGGPCESDKTKSTTTTIEFVCEQNKGYYLGTPSPPSFDGCSLRIQWNTSLVCDPKPIQTNSCQIYHSSTKSCLDLKQLKGLRQLQIPGGKIYFDICGAIKAPSDCKGAEMCLKTQETVAVQNRTISYSGREVQLAYGDVSIIFYCGEDKINKPQYLGKFKKDERYVFNWITPLVCPSRRLSCELDDGKNVYDLGVLRRYNARSIMDGSTTYLINICENIPFIQSTICSSRVTALKNSSKGVLEVIGKDSEQKLYRQDDDGYSIRLEYSSDEATSCPGKKSKVIHKFKCANVNIPPKFDHSSSTSCSFVFLWQTYAACPEERRKIKQTSSWSFEDDKNALCDLELGMLKEKLKNLDDTKDCSFINPVLYSEGEYYELDVDCSRPNQPLMTIDVSLMCSEDEMDGKLVVVDRRSKSELSLEFETNIVCETVRRHSCFNKKISTGAKTALAVIATFTAIGMLAAIVFFACKPEKRERAVMWIRWHVRKYICCKPSYQASYRYRKINTDDGDGETGFIIESHAETLFSDDDDDKANDDDQDDDDEELLPWDDDLLNLDD